MEIRLGERFGVLLGMQFSTGSVTVSCDVMNAWTLLYSPTTNASVCLGCTLHTLQPYSKSMCRGTVVMLLASQIAPLSGHPPALWIHPTDSCAANGNKQQWGCEKFCFVNLCLLLNALLKAEESGSTGVFPKSLVLCWIPQTSANSLSMHLLQLHQLESSKSRG